MHFKNIFAVILAALIICTQAGCAGLSGRLYHDGSAGNGTDSIDTKSDTYLRNAENEGFEEFLSDILRDTLSENGLAIHSYLEHPENFGITEYEPTIGRYDLDALGDTSEITAALARLKSFDRELLSDKHKLTYDQLLYTLTLELEYSDLYLYNTALSTTIGEQLQLPLILAEYSFNELKDVDEYLSIVEDVDEYFANICEFERLRADAGIFMEDYLADEIISQCETFISEASGGFLVSTFKSRLDGLLNTLSETCGTGDISSSSNSGSVITSDAYNAYISRNQAAIDEHVIRGYRILSDTLSELKGSGRYSGGLCNYPDGIRYYEYYLKYNLGWDKTLDEYVTLLSDYTSDVMTRMEQIMNEHPDSYEKSRDFSFQDLSPTETLEQLRELIKDNYPDAPDVEYSVNYVDKSISDSASPALYFTPQLDNIQKNSIYINPDNAGSADIYATLAHEGFPGHLYQTTYFAATQPDLIRYILAPTGYVEGWATYAEVDSYRYADTGDEYLNELMGLNYALTLLIYANVDIGVNYLNWGEDDVYEFVTSFGFRGRRIAKEMYDAMVSEPGNYCRYVLGYIAILKLRDEAKEILGEDYSTKDFNKFVLDTGAIQFDILFEQLNSTLLHRRKTD